MRHLVAFLLSLCIALNAAHTAASGVHEAAAHGTDLLVVSVLQHGHGHDHEHDAGHSLPDAQDMTQAHADHNHAHPPLLSLILTVCFDFCVAGRDVPVIGGRETLVSVPPARLERPPRSPLA